MIRDDLITRLKDRRGVTVIIVAIAIVMLLSFVALAVDIGFVKVTRNELQNVGDASALAAARKLGAMYEANNPAAYLCSTARDPVGAVAVEVGGKNQAAGELINIVNNSSDIQIGDWNTKSKVFTANRNPPNAVRITARRDSSANQPIGTFFARIFGRDTVDISATATAALTGVCTEDEGRLIPVGIPLTWFLNQGAGFCDQNIRFYPTGDATGCAGWNTYERWPASESYLRNDILEAWLAGTFTPPFGEKDDQYSFTGGSLGDQAFTAFLNLFNYMKSRDGDPNDPDGLTWRANVVVYMPEAPGGADCPDPADISCGCANPNQKLRVIGFATVIITDVKPPPLKEIWAKVICDMFDPSHGGCNYFGTYGTIPGLVAEVNQLY